MRPRKINDDEMLVTHEPGEPKNMSERVGTEESAAEREVDGRWVRVADDGDWSTIFRWRRTGRRSSVVAVTWTVPDDAAPGRYRLRYDGNARDTEDRIRAFTGTTQPFDVFR